MNPSLSVIQEQIRVHNQNSFLRPPPKEKGSVDDRFKRAYRLRPSAFVHDCFIWKDTDRPTAYQDEILEELPIKKRVSVRGPHGLGKSAMAAWTILWFALTRDGEDWKCPTTASAWRQLTKFLWPEVHKWSRKLDWDKIGRKPFDMRNELLQLSLKLDTGEAFALASDNHTSLEGAHADHLLYVFDEAKAIPDATFDAAEGAFMGSTASETYALAISTPGEPVGRFYDIHKRTEGYEDWTVRHVTLEEAIAAGRIDRDKAEQRKKQWGEKSALYQNRVEGQFCASDEDGVIPLAWIEAANLRWQEWKDSGENTFEFTGVGADIGRTQDPSVMALRFDKMISEIRELETKDTMETTGKIAGVLSKHGGKAVVDVIGIGAGVVDRLREQGFSVDAFNAGESSDATDRSEEMRFLNKRAAAWWNFRELLDPVYEEGIGIPPSDTLMGELTCPHWKTTSSGKIQIESKDDLKKRIGRSTNYADAVIQIFFHEDNEFLFG